VHQGRGVQPRRTAPHFLPLNGRRQSQDGRHERLRPLRETDIDYFTILSQYCDQMPARKAVGSDEKQQRFERVAEKRVSDLIRRIRLLGNLSNRSNYAYSERHVRHMFTAVERELKLARSRFDGVSGSQAAPFTFRTLG
jgi:hypothetical protein